MTVFEGFQLILNCDFVAVADRKYCQVFYGRERLLDEDVATYSFSDDVSFKKALKTATALSNSPTFEKLWSAKEFEDRPGGYICLKRKRGDSLLYHLHQANRTQQFKTCIKLVKALQKIHEQGRPHGGLDEDNVIYDERLKSPYILEVLSGFFPDQLEPHLCAPEQKNEAPATFATDVYWLANLYLSAIKRPNHKLRQLIKRCRAKDPERRPKLGEVAKSLEEAYRLDLEISVRRWILRPQKSIKFAGMALMASAALILSFDLIKLDEPIKELSFKEELRQDLIKSTPETATLNHIRSLLSQTETKDQLSFVIDSIVVKASSNRDFSEPIKQILKDRFISTPISESREELVDGLSEINYSHDVFTASDSWSQETFENLFVGVMIFDWPILITKKGAYELGDWVIFDGTKGYIARIAIDHIILKNGPNIQKLFIDNPAMLTQLDWQNKNIFINGGQSNMLQVIYAFRKLGFDIIDTGSDDVPGYISGYFSSPNPRDFLEKAEKHLDFVLEDNTVWIQNSRKLKTYIPLEFFKLRESSCEDVFKTLLKDTGIEYRIDPACESPLSFFATEVELKDVIKSMGYSWTLNTQSKTFEVNFYQKE